MEDRIFLISSRGLILLYDENIMIQIMIGIQLDEFIILFKSYQQNKKKRMFSRILKPSFFYQPKTLNYFSFIKKKISIPTPKSDQKQFFMKRTSYLHVAMSCFVFALCFAAIPVYRIFCQHMGLTGDSTKKQYTFQSTKINNLKKYKVIFRGYTDPSIDWQFQPVEKELNVSAGQTAIVFYRLYNKQQKPIVGFATYNISPQDCNVYFSKIQCFCFNQQLINPKQELLLPIFFYLQPQINEDISVSRINQIDLTYNFTRSAKQNLAKFAQEQLKRVEQNKRKLNEIRAKKMNMNISEYITHLQIQQQKQQEQKEKIKDLQQRQQKQTQIAALKMQKTFEEDLMKAQLISKSFEMQQMYGSQKKTSTT